MDELNSLRKKNGETLDCNEWNKLVSVINYIIEFYNQYPTKLSEFENDINFISEENIAPVIQELINNGTLSSILGEPGADGKSAYLLALENGFIGTITEWLASLKGLKGSDGKSAFVLAIDNGYVGTLQQWLDSLKGQPGINGENGSNGIDGKSAYLSYVDTTSDDPILTEEEWIASLKGQNGTDGINGITPHIDLTTGNWFIGNSDTGVHAQGPTGLNGQDGTIADLLLADWNQTDDTSADFIKNKPTIPTKLGLLTGNSSEHDYVEIEGIKWATMNLGANSITDPGLYFQWGDTQGYTADQVGSGEGKKYFGSNSYIYKTYLSDKFSKYNNTDNKYVLDPSDDAVSVAWGNSWRMPTKKEWEILKKATTAEWTNDYQNSGIPGLLLTCKKDNSKVLFFPAAGDAYLSSVYDADTTCAYWLSTRDSNTYSNVDNFSANSEGYLNMLLSRYCGFLVRGVYGGSIFYNEINNKPYIPNTLELNMKYMQFNFYNGTNNKGYFRTEKGFVWATRNIGATLDNDTGLYFSSRDLDGYSSNDIGSSSGQKQFTELEFLLKFNSQYSGVYGTQANDDGENPTVPRDRDAARQIYGGKWRLPTVLDILNLYEESKKIVMESEGIRFYLPAFDYVNTSLFIPKSGYYKDGTHYGSTYPVIRISRGSNYSVDSIGSGSDGYVILNETKPQFYLGDCYVSNFTNLDIPYQVFAGVPIRPILSYTSTAAKVAETGDYNDLINKPVISGGGTVVQSNWNETDTSSPAYILNKPVILNGTNGKSAYELYVDNTSDNPVKTLQEWLASLQGTNGTNGTDGITPHIDPVTKHWMIGETDTNVVAEGKDGTASAAGADGKSAYQSYVDTTSDDPVLTELLWVASLHGADGTNGLNGTNGQDGVTPTIDPTTKHWMLGSTDTGVVAEGQNGTNGTNGTNGITPHIDQTSGNWMIGETDTGVHAQGPSGTSLSNETATQGGTTLSAVTTGEKYTWNLKANIWSGTQAQYDALSPNYDSNTIYIITAAS